MARTPRTVFIDLDSTLCDTRHRHHIIQEAKDAGVPVDWRAYSRACEGDSPYAGAVRLSHLLSRAFHIVIVSGRNDEMVRQTEAWLDRYAVSYDDLVLRQDGEEIDDLAEYRYYQIGRWLSEHGETEPALVVDDWPPTKDLLESFGWPVLLLNPDYERSEYVLSSGR